MKPQPPGGRLPPHLASPEQLADLQERVNAQYGAFGTNQAQEDAADDRVIMADSGWRTTLKIIAGVSAASLFLYFVSHPTFEGFRAWANSFRLDTVFIAVWGPLLAWTMYRLKLWKAVRIYLVLALFIEAFSETMFKQSAGTGAWDAEGGYWSTFLWPANVAWYGTIKEFSGVPGASLPVFFFVTVGLLYRAVTGKKTGAAPPKFARSALLTFLVTVLALAAMGMAQGGQIEWTFRQTIHLLQLPLVALVFLYALRVPEDLAAVGATFVITAVVRGALVFFVYFGICVPNGITSLPGKPEWCTTHSDTVLFVTAIVILIAHAFEQKRKKVTWRALGIGAFLLVAIALNNRRLAFVSLAVAPIVLYLALRPSKTKRRVTAMLAIAAPLLAGYVIVGSEMGSSPVWKPAKLVASVTEQKDSSSQSRDVENENLIYTLSQSPVVPRGFGHEYEYSPNNPPVDLSEVFKNFRLIAHNGVLWMWSIAGVVGFTLLWMIYPLGGTMALRAYKAASSPLERSAALAAVGAIVVCVIQIWGDQGFSSYMTIVTFSVSFAVAARLAARAA